MRALLKGWTENQLKPTREKSCGAFLCLDNPRSLASKNQRTTLVQAGKGALWAIRTEETFLPAGVSLLSRVRQQYPYWVKVSSEKVRETHEPIDISQPARKLSS
jgi:hypothetical protein